MAITLVGGSYARVGSGSVSVSTDLSSMDTGTIQDGDVAVFTVMVDQNDLTSISQDAGPTLTERHYDESTQGRDRASAYYAPYVLDGTETTFTFSSPGDTSEEKSILVSVWRGVDPDNPEDVAWVTGSHYTEGRNNYNGTPDPITTLTDGAVVVIMQTITHDDITAIGPPSGYSVAIDGTGTSRDHAQQCHVYKTVATAGTETPGAFTHTVNNTVAEAQFRTIALRPAATSPVITDVETDEDIRDGDTAVTVTAAAGGFEAAQATGKVELWSDDAGTTKEEQTVESWADGAIDITVVLGASLTPGTLKMVVTNDSGEVSNKFDVTVRRKVPVRLKASTHIDAGGEAITDDLLIPPAGKDRYFLFQGDSNDYVRNPFSTFAGSGVLSIRADIEPNDWTPTSQERFTNNVVYGMLETDGDIVFSIRDDTVAFPTVTMTGHTKSGRQHVRCDYTQSSGAVQTYYRSDTTKDIDDDTGWTSAQSTTWSNPIDTVAHQISVGTGDSGEHWNGKVFRVWVAEGGTEFFDAWANEAQEGDTTWTAASTSDTMTITEVGNVVLTGVRTTGRAWDDENGTDSIDIGDGEYVELVWNIEGIDGVADDETIVFRVVKADGSLLEAYSVTPSIAFVAGGGGTTYDETGRATTLTVSATVSDAATRSESVSSSLSVTATVVDTLNTVEALDDTLTVTAQVADAVTGTEQPATAFTVTATVVDTLLRAEQVSSAATVTATVVDTLTAVEQPATSIAVTATVIDDLDQAFSESLADTITVTATVVDALNAAETATSALAVTAVTVVAVTAAEPVDTTVTVTATVIDAHHSAETLASTATITATVSDDLNQRLTENLDTTVTVTATVVDTLSTSETLGSQATVTATATDEFATADSVDTTLAVTASVSDSLLVAEAVATTIAVTATVVDDLNQDINETAASTFTVVATVTDQLRVAETVGTAATVTATVTAAATAGEPVATTFTVTATVTDTLTFGETVTTTVTFTATVTAGVAYVEVVTSTVTVTAGVTDWIVVVIELRSPAAQIVTSMPAAALIGFAHQAAVVRRHQHATVVPNHPQAQVADDTGHRAELLV